MGLNLRWYCGYVGLPKEHPLYGLDYSTVPEIEVHGGLTYSGSGPLGIDREDLWWLGFDCNHLDDKDKWTKELVIAETNKLAEQL